MPMQNQALETSFSLSTQTLVAITNEPFRYQFQRIIYILIALTAATIGRADGTFLASLNPIRPQL
jgi:hypothetical protein